MKIKTYSVSKEKAITIAMNHNCVSREIAERYTDSELKVGSKLYWIDNPSILAGIVIRFTPKRDVVINFISGNEVGEKNYPISIAKKFVIK